MTAASTPTMVEESRPSDALNTIGRFVAIVAALVPTVLGLIALAKFHWSGYGFHAPAVAVAGMVFRPWIAVATVVLGLFALAAAASAGREGKLFMGGVLVAIGIAVLAANPTVEGVVINHRMGWMAILVGAVLAVVALVAGPSWASRRVRRGDPYVR